MPASLVTGTTLLVGAGGNDAWIVCPVRGGGLDLSRSAKSCWSSGSTAIGFIRSSSAVASASVILVAGTSLDRSYAAARCTPSESRTSSPGGASPVCCSAWLVSPPPPVSIVVVRDLPPHDESTNATKVSHAIPFFMAGIVTRPRRACTRSARPNRVLGRDAAR